MRTLVIDEGILLYAFRYALGRRTFAPSDVQSAIVAALPLQDAGVRDAMVRELEAAVALSEAPAAQRVHALGSPTIDAPGWRALLERLRANA